MGLQPLLVPFPLIIRSGRIFVNMNMRNYNFDWKAGLIFIEKNQNNFCFLILISSENYCASLITQLTKAIVGKSKT